MVQNIVVGVVAATQLEEWTVRSDLSSTR